jgi:sulfur relay (sulfurtransferase) complex TusBCD TusD component (DsrE family)
MKYLFIVNDGPYGSERAYNELAQLTEAADKVLVF